MARDKNTFIKRQRETQKRQKAEDKRARRQKRKDEPSVVDPAADPRNVLLLSPTNASPKCPDARVLSAAGAIVTASGRRA